MVVLTPVDVEKQSLETSEGYRRSPITTDELLNVWPDVFTCYDSFRRGMRETKDGKCLGTRTGPDGEYEWITFDTVYERAKCLGTSLIRNGAQAKNTQLIGIMCSNGPEWIYTDLACCMYSMVLVPIYETFSKESIKYILNLTEMDIMVCKTVKQAHELLSMRPDISQIYIVESFEKSENDSFISFYDAIEYSKSDLLDEVPPKPEDINIISFTSGTTNESKGVIITHENIMLNTNNVYTYLTDFKLTHEVDDTHFSYMPLSHIFEKACHALCFTCGIKVGYFTGDVKNLFSDMQALKPTMFFTVPRILTKLYDTLITRAANAPFYKRWMFNMALNRKMALLDSGVVTKDTIWDTLVFSKVQDLLGGRVRFVVSGSAPLAGHVHQFFRCAFGCTIMQGYGLTESSAATSLQLHNDYNSDTIGALIPNNILKLVDVPELEYSSKDNKGEICLKGKNITNSYYKNEEATREAIDEDGWFHTGDIGMINKNGSLTLIDRVKHYFKLSQGEFIAPEKCETICLASVYVEQIFYYGNPNQSYPVALVVPDEAAIMKLAREKNIAGDFSEVCKSDLIKDIILADIVMICKGTLNGYEIVKNIHLHSEIFSIENKYFTPTMKLRRLKVRKDFKTILESLYT